MDGYRHELKYYINLADWALLRERLPALMTRDRHAGPGGEYHIRSLYFDDYWDTAYTEKELGVLSRRKYRVRVYNCSDDVISLERKGKHGQYIKKVSAPLTRAQYDAVMAGDYKALLDSPHTLHKEFYFECTSRILRPRVIVDYDREPFIYDAGNVRITFDKHVRAGFGEFSLFDAALPALEVIPGDRMVMEVKFTQFLPGAIRRLLPTRAHDISAISKYVLCRDAAAREFSLDRTEGLQWTRH